MVPPAGLEPKGQDQVDGQEPKTEETDGQEPKGQEQQGTSLTDIKALQDQLNKARNEAADYRAKLKETQKSKQDEADKTVDQLKGLLEEAQEKLDATEKRAQQALVRAQVTAVAAKLGFNDPSDAWSMIDHETLEVSGDGQIKDVEAALKGLLEAKPYLAKQKGTITPTNPPGGTPPETDEAKRARLYGKGSASFFDGGGVILPE